VSDEPAGRHVSFRASRPGNFEIGVHLGTTPTREGLAFAEPVGRRRYADPHVEGVRHRLYEWSAWLAPTVTPRHRFGRLVASWNARTPADSWLEVEVRTSADDVHWSRWYVLGRWAGSDVEIHPTSVPGQSDENAAVQTDELVARRADGWSSYQLRVTLLRPAGSTTIPVVSLLGAVASGPDEGPDEAPRDGAAGRSGGVAHGVELTVPTYSQQLHRGQDPHLDQGGESWCSPTSTSMVLARWALGPTAGELGWVDPTYVDPLVNHAARFVFDHAYGAGNWSFNTAYAAGYGTEAFVTRLRSLDEAERFIAAGIPLVASVSFTREQLDRSGYDTAGHLLVIVGFDESGDVICNDPASHEVADNAEVRVVYDRDQFTRVWQRSAGGMVYVIRPADVPLPPVSTPAEPNW
jgi:hypothetical protein